MQSRECQSPKEGEFRFTHVPCRHWQPHALVAFNPKKSSQRFRMRPGHARKEPRSISSIPLLERWPRKGRVFVCFQCLFFFFTFSTTYTALLTLKSIFHGPDLYTVVSTSPGIQGQQGWHPCLHFFMSLGSDLFPSVPSPITSSFLSSVCSGYLLMNIINHC